jgi:hypothetical protein
MIAGIVTTDAVVENDGRNVACERRCRFSDGFGKWIKQNGSHKKAKAAQKELRKPFVSFAHSYGCPCVFIHGIRSSRRQPT